MTNNLQTTRVSCIWHADPNGMRKYNLFVCSSFSTMTCTPGIDKLAAYTSGRLSEQVLILGYA